MGLKMTYERMKHNLAVARKMVEITEKKCPLEKDFIQDMFILGLVHNVGHEYTDFIDEYQELGGLILRRQEYKYWEEVFNHGKAECEFKSLALDILNEANLCIDPQGNEVKVKDRLDDIRRRYGFESNHHVEAYNLAKFLNLV